MSDATEEFVDVRIELPLPMDITATLLRVIGLTWPGTLIKDGKGQWRSDSRLVLAIPKSERHKSPKKAEKYEKVKAHLDGWADTVLNDLGPSGAGFGLPEYVADLLIGMCRMQFELYPDAENYTEAEVYDRENHQRYVVICARSDEQTPHELRRQAEAGRDVALAETARLQRAVARVLGVADAYEETASELPQPHGPATEAFTTAARDIRQALRSMSDE